MKRYFLATLFCLSLAAPVAADDVHSLFSGGLPTGSHNSPSEAEAMEFHRARLADRRRMYEQYVAAGWCNSEFLPLEIALACNAKPFGYPTMGSEGGD